MFNVGDIKPMELPLTFALALAWDINSITPTSLPVFFDSYSNREFGPNHTKEIADLLLGHDRLMGLRRHEHIEPDTFSILHHREAETVLQRYQDIEARANSLLNLLPDPQKAAFFQVVLHPIKASRINTELRISQAKNQLYGLQRRNTTNALAQRVLDLFDEDFELSQEYHNSPWVGKKWNHIVKQPHYGYTGETWHAPTRDLITGLSYVQRRQDSTRIAGQLGIAVEGHAGIRPGLACEEIDRTHPSRHELVVGLTLPTTNPYDYASHYFEIYSRGSCVLEWTVNVSETWIVVSRTAGRSSPVDTNDHRIEITIDWANVPQDFQGTVEIEVQSDGGDYEIVHLPIDNRRVPSDFSGFVQSEGCVSIEVGRLSLTECQRQFYQHLPFLGRTGQGGIQRSEAAMDDIPSLEYSFFTFSAVSEIVLHLFFTMAIEVDEDHPLLYDISVDDLVRTEVPLLESKSKGALPEAWSTAVQDGVWTRRHTFPINTSGSHTVRYRPLVARLILEKIVVDIGGIPQSYLGPPPSYQSCKEKRRSQYHSIT